MNIILKGYQLDAVAKCYKGISRAVEDWEDDRAATAVSLSAATSAGKTIIATALIERLRFGDGTIPENPDFTVLWLTNSPSLNKQTEAKMLATSSHIKPHHLHVIEEDTAGSSLAPGRIYFLNTQKLSSGATKFQQSESRPVSLWKMLRNTVDALGTNFLLIIDEAHIGTDKKTSGEGKIAYRLMGGDDDAKSGQFPIVLGISATPKRFKDAVSATARAISAVEVPVDEIRASGLIKDRILAHVPQEGQYAESKLMEAAIAKWQESDTAWAEYHAAHPTTMPVTPLLLIQVPPAVEASQLNAILAQLESQDERLTGIAVAHAFGEPKGALEINGRTVERIEPEAIQGATHVRAVLFKDALTTGWDCPRAETMLSLRSAHDQTYITQMVGRMVRTPLAARIEGNDFLNDVTLYLPRYNLESINQVKKELSSGDDSAVTSEFIADPHHVTLIDSVMGVGESGMVEDDTILRTLRQIVSHRRPGRLEPATRRLGSLAAMLEGAQPDPLVKNAETLATKTLVDVLHSAYLEHRDEIDAKVAAFTDTEVRVVNLGDGVGGAKSVDKGDEQESYVASGLPSIGEADLAFRAASRLCGSDRALRGLWSVLAGEDMTMPDYDAPDKHIDTQMVATEVGLLPGMRTALEQAAEARFDGWVKAHGLTLRASNPYAFADLMAGTREGGETFMRFPLSYDVGGEFVAPAGHIYVDDSGEFHVAKALNDWETKTVTAMAKKFPGFVGWWRNGTGGDQSLGVRYTDTGGDIRTMYPDFLGIYRQGDEVTLRLFDPHADYHDGNSRTKWLGLAAYLGSKSNTVISEAYAVVLSADGALRAIDLADDEVVAMLTDANIDLEKQVFLTKGFVLS